MLHQKFSDRGHLATLRCSLPRQMPDEEQELYGRRLGTGNWGSPGGRPRSRCAIVAVVAVVSDMRSASAEQSMQPRAITLVDQQIIPIVELLNGSVHAGTRLHRAIHAPWADSR